MEATWPSLTYVPDREVTARMTRRVAGERPSRPPSWAMADRNVPAAAAHPIWSPRDASRWPGPLAYPDPRPTASRDRRCVLHDRVNTSHSWQCIYDWDGGGSCCTRGATTGSCTTAPTARPHDRRREQWGLDDPRPQFRRHHGCQWNHKLGKHIAIAGERAPRYVLRCVSPTSDGAPRRGSAARVGGPARLPTGR